MPRILVTFFAFLLLANFSNAYAQSADCRQKYKDWVSTCEKDVTVCNECQGNNKNPVCDKACNDSVDKCIQAQDTLDACLGVDRKTWMLEPQTPGHLTCDEWKKLSMLGAAQNCPDLSWQSQNGGAWCSASIDEGIRRTGKVPPDYIFDFDYNSCTSSATADDVKLFNTGSSSRSGSSPVVSQQKTNKAAATSGNNSSSKTDQINLFKVNPIEIWRNIQAILDIRKNFNINNLVESGEFLTGAKEIPMVVPEPSIATDSEGKPWDFLPGYIPHESIEQGKTIQVIERMRLTDKNNQNFYEVRPGSSNQAVLKIPGKDENDLPFLEMGEVEVVKKLTGISDSSYDGIKTPNGTILSVQTHYLVSYDKNKNQTTVAVYEGKVEVKTNDGKVTSITPNGNKPGAVTIAQKLSVTKITVVSLVLAIISGGVAFFLKRKFSAKKPGKKK